MTSKEYEICGLREFYCSAFFTRQGKNALQRIHIYF
jgi:hypothetical protein